jgi:hypothetical protein
MDTIIPAVITNTATPTKLSGPRPATGNRPPAHAVPGVIPTAPEIDSSTCWRDFPKAPNLIRFKPPIREGGIMGQAIAITREEHSAGELRKLAGESDPASPVSGWLDICGAAQPPGIVLPRRRSERHCVPASAHGTATRAPSHVALAPAAAAQPARSDPPTLSARPVPGLPHRRLVPRLATPSRPPQPLPPPSADVPL